MGLKKNFFYNSVLSISNYVFPFLTFPYISRVLRVGNLGKCNFVDGIVGYFLLFASLGIGVIGIREIAKNKHDKLKLNEIFSSLLILNFITTVIVSIIYILCIIYVSDLHLYKELLYIGLAKIISTLFLIEWFYAGIENFRYITIRSVLVKVVYVFLVFLFVKQPQDYRVYFFLTVLTTIFNATLNIIYSRNFVKLTIKNISIKLFWSPIVTMGVYSLLTNMYTSFNVIYLGFMFGDRQVGFYTTATKIYTILLSVFTAFTSVMLPRMSQLVAEKKIAEIGAVINKSYDALFMISIPMLVVGTILAPQIIDVIAGKGYEGAVIPMQIVMPLILIIGIAEILIIQILMPFNNDRYIFINSLIGAVVGVGLNLLLVGKLSAVGSAISLLASEIAVVISAGYFVKREINLVIPYNKIFMNLLFSIPYVIFCWLGLHFLARTNSIVIIGFVAIISAIYFMIAQKFFLRNVLFMQLEKNIRTNISSFLHI